jgi:DNA uptake protein ComE-like DNA-binding protein
VTRRYQKRNGFILVMVLVVVLLASMIAASLLFVMHAERAAAAAGSSSEQAWATAMSGVYHAMRVAANAEPGTVSWRDNAEVFRDQLVADDGVRKWYFSICAWPETGAEGIRFGLSDEASKMNVFRATEAMLEAVPNLTPTLALSLLSATGGGGGLSSPPAADGSKTNADSLVAPSVSPSLGSGSFTCLDDLLQVSGFSPRLIYGEYPNLQSGNILADTSASMAYTDGLVSPLGLKEFLTVASYDPNQDNQGTPRLDLNQADTDLSGLNLSQAVLSYLDALRTNHQTLAHPAALLDATNKVKDAQGKEVSLSSGIGKAELALVLDRCTTTNLTNMVGLVNLNTASATVLAALPGLNASLADAIVAARTGLNPDAQKTPAWLYEDGILNADAFKQVAPYLTTRSYQFNFLVAAYSVPAGSYRMLEVIVDVATKPPAVLLLRDVSQLGLPSVLTAPTDDSGPPTPSITMRQPSPKPRKGLFLAEGGQQ